MRNLFFSIVLMLSTLGLQAQLSSPGCFVSGVHPGIVQVGQIAHYAASPTRGGTYQWSTSGNISINSGLGTSSIQITKNTSAPGYVKVDVYFSDGTFKCSGYQPVVSTTTGPSIPAAPAWVSSSLNNCYLGVSFAASSGATSYKIYIDGVFVSTTSSTSALFNLELISSGFSSVGSHSICVYAANSAGQSGPKCNNYWSYNSCGDEIIIMPKTGLSRVSSLQIFPNPARQHVSIRLPEGTPSEETQIADVQGRTVFRNTGPAHELNISALSPGMYFVRVRAQNGAVYNGKFHKE